MRLTEADKKQFAAFAKGNGSFLIKYLEKVKDEVADVRSQLITVNPNIENDVRKAVCDVLDQLFISQIQRDTTKEKKDGITEEYE